MGNSATRRRATRCQLRWDHSIAEQDRPKRSRRDLVAQRRNQQDHDSVQAALMERSPSTGVVCSCGWRGANWSEAKDHVVDAMRTNETLVTPVLHEVMESTDFDQEDDMSATAR